MGIFYLLQPAFHSLLPVVIPPVLTPQATSNRMLPIIVYTPAFPASPSFSHTKIHEVHRFCNFYHSPWEGDSGVSPGHQGEVYSPRPPNTHSVVWLEARRVGISVWEPWRCKGLVDTSFTHSSSPLGPARPGWYSRNKGSSLESLWLVGCGGGGLSKVVLIMRAWGSDSHKYPSAVTDTEVLWREMGQSGCKR